MKKLERVHELRGRFQNWSNAMRSSATTHMTGKFVKYVFDDFGLLRDVNGNAYVYEAKSAENVGAHMAEQLYTLLQQEPFTLRKYFNLAFSIKSTRPGLDAYDKTLNRPLITVPFPRKLTHFEFWTFDSRLGENGGFFFATEDIARNRNLVVLIHGRGAVRAGQWSRRLILSEGLAAGSQLEYIRQCRNRGWAVLVMNTNHNTVTNVWQLKPHAIKGSATAEEHGINVWQAVVAGSRARNIAIIAHSYGGKVAEEIIHRVANLNRIRAICLLDSIIQIDPIDNSGSNSLYVRNWISSSRPVGSSEPARMRIPCESAGTTEHERVPAFAIERVFQFIDEQFITSDTEREIRKEQAIKQQLSPTTNADLPADEQRPPPPTSPVVIANSRSRYDRCGTWSQSSMAPPDRPGRRSVKDLVTEMELQRRQAERT